MNCRMRYLVSYKTNNGGGSAIVSTKRPIRTAEKKTKIENALRRRSNETLIITGIQLLSNGRKIRRR